MNSNPRLAHLDSLRERLRPLCQDYVARHRPVAPGRKFSCINPAHPDKDPSMGFVPGAPELCHCFGCGVTCDIFTAAHMIEGRPISGPGFLIENMFYLAEIFGMEVPAVTLTPEDQREMDILRAHTCASNIITSSQVSPLVAQKLAEYGWSDLTQQTLGIGSVVSYDSYMDLMLNTYGFSADFLNSVDLDNSRIFHPDHLIFTVRDEFGQAVGFASRNLHYDAAKARYNQAVEQFGKDSREANEAKRAMPTKFINSAASATLKDGTVVQKNHIYRKGERLFALNIARKYAPPLFIFEGYGDGATAQDRGLHNACAIGALAFTKEHLETLLRMGIDHLIFVFDGDKAGGKGTKSAIEKVEAIIKQNIGLKVQIILIPEEDDDPDLFIRTHGLDAFLNLERIDIFAFKMMSLVADGGDPDQVFEDSVGLILNEPNHRLQFRMAQSLSIATGIPETIVCSEVERRRDLAGQKIKAEMVTVAQNTVKELQKRPEAIVEILREGSTRVERLAGRKSENDTEALLRYFDSLTDKSENDFELGGLLTGYPIFDARFGGIPKEDAFLTFPGKANHGKAQPLDALLKTPTGWIRMGDVRVGDQMASLDGAESIVTGIFPQGVEKVYKVTFDDGRSVECSGEHLWTVAFCDQYAPGYGDDKHNGWLVFSTDAIRAMCLNGSRKNNHRTVHIPTVNGEFGHQREVPINPWLLGVLLGDGGIISGSPVLTNLDAEVVQRVEEEAQRLDLVLSSCNDGKSWRVVQPGGRGVNTPNVLTTRLRELGLWGVSGEKKFIPEEYLLAQKAVRLALLQGLMDTDGTAGKTGETSYTSCSESLARDVQTLVRSLGGLATIHSKTTRCRYKGEVILGTAYTVNIRMLDRSQLFSVKRKQIRTPERTHFPRLTIANVECVGEKETQCISVSHPSKLYITNDYIVTHNTTLGCNILGRIVDAYPDVVALFHTIDDPFSKAWTRLCSSRFGIPSYWFEKAGYHIRERYKVKIQGEYFEFGDIYHSAKKWLRDRMIEERLQAFDVSLMDPTLDVLESKIIELRKRYANSPIIVFCDNFHKYQVPGDGKESDIRGMSSRLQQITTKQHVTIMSTMEIPKGVMAPGIRPRADNMKGSGGIVYDSSANIGVYNDKKDMRDKAVLTWDEILDEPEEIAPGQTIMRKEQPVLEMIFDKSKIFKGFDGEIYYRLHPESGMLEECDAFDQDRYRKKALQAQEEREERKKGKGGRSEGGSYGGSRVQSRSYPQHIPSDPPF